MTRSQSQKQDKDMFDFMEKCKSSFENVEKKLENIEDNNKKISDDINEMKDQIIQNLIKSNKNLQNKVQILEKKLENIENDQKNITISVESNNQYVRRNNLEISGIPNSVSDEDLESKVIEILSKINIKLQKKEIEACHRLPPTRKNPTKKTIIRFVNRKKAEKSLKNKKMLG